MPHHSYIFALQQKKNLLQNIKFYCCSVTLMTKTRFSSVSGRKVLKITVKLNFDRLSFRSITFKPLKVSPFHEYSTRTDKGFCVIFLTWKVLPRQHRSWFESFKYFGNKKLNPILLRNWWLPCLCPHNRCSFKKVQASFVWIPDWIKVQVDYAIWDFYWKLFFVLEARALEIYLHKFTNSALFGRKKVQITRFWPQGNNTELYTFFEHVFFWFH